MKKKKYQSNRLTLHNHKIKLCNNISNKKIKNSAIFFDRDGVLIDDMNYISNPLDVKILPGVKELLKISNMAGWLNIVITNQSGISRGLLDWEDYEKVTEKMIKLLGDECLIGSRCIVAEGARVGDGVVLGAGAVLTASIPVIDGETGEEISRGEIPPWCVAVQASRPREFPGGEFGLPCVLVVKRLSEGERHDKSALNEILRNNDVTT